MTNLRSKRSLTTVLEKETTTHLHNRNILTQNLLVFNLYYIKKKRKSVTKISGLHATHPKPSMYTHIHDTTLHVCWSVILVHKTWNHKVQHHRPSKQMQEAKIRMSLWLQSAMSQHINPSFLYSKLYKTKHVLVHDS